MPINKYYPKEYGTEEIMWLMENEKKVISKTNRSVSVSKYTDGSNDPNIKYIKAHYHYDIEKLRLIGGDFLVRLYELNSNLELTAQEMGITYNNATQKLFRIREKLKRQGIKSKKLFNDFLLGIE